MADVEQKKKIVSLITCKIAFGQNVCELMFGTNVWNLNCQPTNQPTNTKQLCGFVKHACCGTSPFIIILIAASLTSKTYNIALESECVPLDGT